MGRNSRAKKERRAAERRGKTGSSKKPKQAGGIQVITVRRDGGHGPYDDCPICRAMQEMGLGDSHEVADDQLEQLMGAFAEAEAAGGVRLGPWSGTN
jgi:hypothetical protein